MKPKKFGPLDIVMTRTKMQGHTSSVKQSWRAGQSKCIGKRLCIDLSSCQMIITF